MMTQDWMKQVMEKLTNNNIVYVMSQAGDYHLAHHSSVQKLKEWLSRSTEGHRDHICLC